MSYLKKLGCQLKLVDYNFVPLQCFLYLPELKLSHPDFASNLLHKFITLIICLFLYVFDP